MCNLIDADTSRLALYSHEEAYTMLMIHAADLVYDWLKEILIRTVDTDVVVIVVGCFQMLQTNSIWITIAAGKHFRYIPVHGIVNSLGPLKSRLLSLLHPFTGCDTTSTFAGIIKKPAWNTLIAFPEVTKACLTEQPNKERCRESVFQVLQRFVILLTVWPNEYVHGS